MGRKKRILSKLVTFVATAKYGNSDNFDQWEVTFQGNRIREEKSEWLAMAHTGGFREVKLTRKTDASAKTAAIQTKADIAREGLALLDEILASRKTTTNATINTNTTNTTINTNA